MSEYNICSPLWILFHISKKLTVLIDIVTQHQVDFFTVTSIFSSEKNHKKKFYKLRADPEQDHVLIQDDQEMVETHVV